MNFRFAILDCRLSEDVGCTIGDSGLTRMLDVGNEIGR
jgi:hypothetical protein